jgi:hypothetical protein
MSSRFFGSRHRPQASVCVGSWSVGLGQACIRHLGFLRTYFRDDASWEMLHAAIDTFDFDARRSATYVSDPACADRPAGAQAPDLVAQREPPCP